MSGHVFISYSRQDIEFVRALVEKLRRGGVHVWYDERLQCGEDFSLVLERKIETCAVFVVVITPAANASSFIRREILAAERYRRDIRPLRRQGKPPLLLSHLQYLDVEDGRIPPEFIDQLRAAAPLRPEVAPGSLGPIGQAALAAELEGLGLPSLPPPVDGGALADMEARLAGMDPSPEVAHARRVVADLGLAIETRALLQEYLPEAIDPMRLRPALMAALKTGAPRELHDETDFTEHVALAYPAEQRDCRESMARFVAALALAAGRGIKYRPIGRWIKRNGATMAANALVAEDAAARASRRCRLVVSLHASLTPDFPTRLVAWLLHDTTIRQQDFPCRLEHDDLDEDAARVATEAALREAVLWGVNLAYDEFDHELERLEIAVPARIALSWRPEQVEVGEVSPMLLANFTLVTRWSQRIDPPPELSWVNQYAAKRLRQIDAHRRKSGEPVHWLLHDDIADDAGLTTALRTGAYSGAIGLAGRRLADARLAELLLRFSPILLWPSEVDELPAECAVAVAEHWESLPDAFTTAYRHEARGKDGGPLAALRAVWDDHEWIDFCRSQRIR